MKTWRILIAPPRFDFYVFKETNYYAETIYNYFASFDRLNESDRGKLEELTLKEFEKPKHQRVFPKELLGRVLNKPFKANSIMYKTQLQSKLEEKRFNERLAKKQHIRLMREIKRLTKNNN